MQGGNFVAPPQAAAYGNSNMGYSNMGYSNMPVESAYAQGAVQIAPAENFDMSEYSGCSSCASPQMAYAPQESYAAPIQTNQVYQPAVAAGKRANNLFGISGLAFGINNGNSKRGLSRSGTGELKTDSIDQDDLTGVEAVFARRKSYGDGFELRYFNLDSGANSASLSDNPYVTWGGDGYVGNAILPSIGLSGIGKPGVTAKNVFDDARTHTVTRESNINNFELNWLRRGRSHGRRSVEYLVGFRYFQFDDSLSFSASDIGPSSVPGYINPEFASYDSQVENDLYGVQFGRRSQISLFKRVSLFFGVNGGLFNNRITSLQTAGYSFADGSFDRPDVLQGQYAGTPVNFKSEKDDLSLLGEVDLGLIYQISNRLRARIGYRGIGVSNIAFAGDQLEDQLWDVKRVQKIDNDADLILNGGYAGLEFAW